MSIYLEKYGQCIIPKGTLLYRGHESDDFQDIMFFATKYLFARVFNHRVQIWKVKKPIVILFLVKSLNFSSWAEPSIPDLFYDIFPDETKNGLDDLDIKHRNIQRRDYFASKLIELDLKGWLTSIEGKIELEVCLLGKQNIKETLEIIRISEENLKEQYYRDSLKKIQIFPNQAFYQMTEKKIDKSHSRMYCETDPFTTYKRIVDKWVKEEIGQGVRKAKSVHSFSDLRLKLKI